MPVLGSVEECEFKGFRVSRSSLGGAVVKFCTTTRSLWPIAAVNITGVWQPMNDEKKKHTATTQTDTTSVNMVTSMGFWLVRCAHFTFGSQKIVRQVHTLFVESAEQVVVYELQVQEEREGVRQEVREIER